MFSCEFWEIFKNNFFTGHFWVTAFIDFSMENLFHCAVFIM